MTRVLSPPRFPHIRSLLATNDALYEEVAALMADVTVGSLADCRAVCGASVHHFAGGGVHSALPSPFPPPPFHSVRLAGGDA
jgi:hypothetical protein